MSRSDTDRYPILTDAVVGVTFPVNSTKKIKGKRQINKGSKHNKVVKACKRRKSIYCM
ncbi:hypothetical protein M6B38_319055 [Iris pallida]|uniref:Uncharacterized protein n=1 Tax=Iris pallida TaxID=29817 RepID=A0AAX6HCG5_IRIPA|nr:hypothetical protein M6B38_319055 [Iris pallida]